MRIATIAAFCLACLVLLSCATPSVATVDAAVAFTEVGRTYIELGMVSEAIQAFRKSLELYPALNDARFELALLLVKSNRMADALAEISYLDQQKTSNWEQTRKLLGFYYAALGENSEALEVYEQLIDAEGGDYHSYYNAGLMSLRMDLIEDAEKYFSRAFISDSSQVGAAVQLARLHYSRAEYTKVVLGLEEFQSDIVDSPSDAVILINSYIRLEDYLSGLTLMERVVDRYGTGVSIDEDARSGYSDMLYKAVELASSIAMDDDLSLKFARILSEAEYVEVEDWESLLESVSGITLVPNTIDFIRERTIAPSEAGE